MLPVMGGHIQAGEMLFAAGALPPPLQMMQHDMRGNLSAVREALAAGFDSNLADAIVIGAEGTALHRAAEIGRSDLIVFPLEAGAYIDPRLSDNRKTPLHLAAMNAHVEVVESLLVAGADVNTLKTKGHTPLDESLGRRDLEASRVICAASRQQAQIRPLRRSSIDDTTDRRSELCLFLVSMSAQPSKIRCI
jgi:ankyrin repeat protein